MGKVAFVFPGQASQYPGMGRELAEKYPIALAVFDEADKALGFSISKICFEGTEDELKLTANTQPAILTVSVAAFRVLAEKGISPDYVAGHSLGEYSALVATGALTFADAVRLVRKRGTYMQDAVPAGQGAMAAILGISPAVVQDACKRAAEGEICSAANLNSPEQTVISGHANADKAGGGNCLAIRGETCRDFAGVCAISLRHDDAGAGKTGKRFTGHTLFGFADSSGDQRGR